MGIKGPTETYFSWVFFGKKILLNILFIIVNEKKVLLKKTIIHLRVALVDLFKSVSVVCVILLEEIRK